jgi:hypothetical protein
MKVRGQILAPAALTKINSPWYLFKPLQAKLV